MGLLAASTRLGPPEWDPRLGPTEGVHSRVLHSQVPLKGFLQVVSPWGNPCGPRYVATTVLVPAWRETRGRTTVGKHPLGDSRWGFP